MSRGDIFGIININKHNSWKKENVMASPISSCKETFFYLYQLLAFRAHLWTQEATACLSFFAKLEKRNLQFSRPGYLLRFDELYFTA